MRFKEIHLVKEGDILAKALYDNESRLLINKNIKLTNSFIKKIKDYGIQGIYVEDEISENIDINLDITPELKAETIVHLKTLNIDKTLEDAKKIVKILKESNEFCNYINIKTFDNYTYEHSLSVSIFATIIGIACDYSEKELENLSLAGLLHDLGKRAIDDEIINKPSKLTPEEYEIIKSHSQIGYNILQDDYLISSTVKTSILEHHENEDGTGYPRGLKSNNIYKFAKIIHIVDVYDALISKRPYKEPFSPKEAIDYIVQNTNTMFDEKYVEVFLKVIPAYPKGVLVKLSNGESGIVIENYQGFVLRPKILLLNGKTISLKDDKDYQQIEII